MLVIIVAILNAQVIATLVVIYKNINSVAKPIKVMASFKLFIFMLLVLLLYIILIGLYFKEAFEKNYKEKSYYLVA